MYTLTNVSLPSSDSSDGNAISPSVIDDTVPVADGGNSNYVEPDVSVICDKDKLDERGCNGAPDWIIEVISPSSKRMDRSIKLFKYRSAGVREYWMIDPNKNTVTVYFFEEDFVEDYTLSDMVPAHIYEDLEIDFSVLDLS